MGLKLIEMLKDAAFKLEYDNAVKAAASAAVSEAKAEGDKALETAVNAAVLESENSQADKLKAEYDRGRSEAIKEYKAAAAEKGKGEGKPKAPSCFKKYPKEPNAKCRACNFAQKCKGKK